MIGRTSGQAAMTGGTPGRTDGGRMDSRPGLLAGGTDGSRMTYKLGNRTGSTVGGRAVADRTWLTEGRAGHHASQSIETDPVLRRQEADAQNPWGGIPSQRQWTISTFVQAWSTGLTAAAEDGVNHT